MKKQTNGEKDIRFLVREQVPHKDKMLLIDGMAWKDGDSINLSFVVPADNIFVAPDGVLAPVALIEMLAQLCGAQHTFDQGLRADDLHGYLVGIDHVTFSGPVRAGDELAFAAWKTFDMQDIKRIKGEVRKGSELKAAIELTLFESAAWIPKPQIPVMPEDLPHENFVPGGLFSREKDAIGKGIMASIAHVAVQPGGETEAAMVFTPGFVGFSGHFPGYPVLAAILAVYSGWLLAEISQKQEMELCSIKRAKFMAPILPYEKLEVSLKKTSQDGGDEDWYSLTIKSLGKFAAKFTIGTKPSAGRVRP
jgi:3-hydroxyacyl-[acyl-carrier-protein] dehydratase